MNGSVTFYKSVINFKWYCRWKDSRIKDFRTGEDLLGAPPLPILVAKERALEREEGSLGTLPNLQPAIIFSFVGPHEVIKYIQRYYFGLGTEINNIFKQNNWKIAFEKVGIGKNGHFY